MRAVVILLLFLVPACDGSTPSFSGVVPYKYIPAPDPSEDDAESLKLHKRTPSTPSCVGQLQAEVLSGTNAREAFNLNLMTDGDPCYLERGPSVIVDGGAIPAHVDTELSRFDQVLASGDRLNLSLYSRDCSTDEAPREVDIELQFDDGSVLDAGSSDQLGCKSGMPAALGRGAWFFYPPEDVEGPLDGLELSGRNIPKKVRGDAIEFEIVLSNPTDEDVPLDPCPMFMAGWGESGLATHSYSYLNCDEAPEEIRAGGSVPFAIEIPIADDLIEGEGGSYTGSIVFSLYDEEGSGVGWDGYPQVTVFQK